MGNDILVYWFVQIVLYGKQSLGTIKPGQLFYHNSDLLHFCVNYTDTTIDWGEVEQRLNCEIVITFRRESDDLT